MTPVFLSFLLSFLKGMLIGLPFVFAIGPALFSILQTSISKGFYSGMQLAIGISLSDLLIMFLCYFGLIQYFEKDIFQIALGFGGSAIMVIYGIYMFNKKTASKPIQKEINLKINWTGVFKEIVTGFFLNIMNPFLWILWLSIVSSGTTSGSTKEGIYKSIFFMLGIVSMIFTTDLLKSFFANKIKKLLSAKVIIIINKVAGILLFLCAIFLLTKTLIEFGVIPWEWNI
ncbi:MAG: LysE family transporter [Bacteroidales bacterium]|nr:LysE family transporter [Bacteroidales bacterium]